MRENYGSLYNKAKNLEEDEVNQSNDNNKLSLYDIDNQYTDVVDGHNISQVIFNNYDKLDKSQSGSTTRDLKLMTQKTKSENELQFKNSEAK